ncbi:MAG: baseplate J/gp47 family protein [Candidatus Adiutrix sp.]|jgi:hypothetical protein|nr:baseplate J/gp47 family protein [Candidatus Adiutrix sp.]
MAESNLIFDPATGLYAPDTADIRAAVADDWVLAFQDPDLPPLDTEPTTPAGQLIDAEVAEVEAKNAAMLFMASQFNPRVSDGRWQDGIGYIYFIERKLAEPSVVTCQLTGLNGTVIPYGALVGSVTGHTLICNSSAAIGPDGTAETTFRNAEWGPVDFAPHSVNSIITVVPGWDTVDNEAAGALGRELETRAEFEARRFNSVVKNAHGSVPSLFGEIANIDGVLDCLVLENIGPDPAIKYGVEVPGHGIVVCVYGGDDSAIAEAIYRKKDNGCDTGGNTDITYTASDYHNALYEYKIMRPEPVNFWIRVSMGKQSGLTQNVVDALKQALYDDFYGDGADEDNSRVGLATTVYASRFYCSASSVPGVKNILSIEIALSNDDPQYADAVTINGDQEPTLSLANIAVILQA